MSNNRVIHFEIQADDVSRAKKFYENAFGWKIDQVMTLEQGGMDYWGLKTGEDGTPGINGGLYQRRPENKIYTYDCTIQVEDLDKSIEDVKNNGGTITSEKWKFPGWVVASALDPEGNKFGLMQPTQWEAK
jgi:predicted enzyme related to lactoylglutathione lyase